MECIDYRTLEVALDIRRERISRLVEHSSLPLKKNPEHAALPSWIAAILRPFASDSSLPEPKFVP